MTTIAKNTICIWYDGDAEEAARFYAATFPDSRVDAVHRAPADYPSGKAGDVLTVMFTVMGIPCMGLNGGPAVQHNIAFSFQVATTDQTETDRYWNAIIGNGGQVVAAVALHERADRGLDEGVDVLLADERALDVHLAELGLPVGAEVIPAPWCGRESPRGGYQARSLAEMALSQREMVI